MSIVPTFEWVLSYNYPKCSLWQLLREYYHITWCPLWQLLSEYYHIAIPDVHCDNFWVNIIIWLSEMSIVTTFEWIFSYNYSICWSGQLLGKYCHTTIPDSIVTTSEWVLSYNYPKCRLWQLLSEHYHTTIPDVDCDNFSVNTII